MTRRRKNSSLSLTKVIELIGKPSFFLFTSLFLFLALILKLITKATQKLSSLRFFALPSPSLRRSLLKLPSLSLPHLPRFILPLFSVQFLLGTLCSLLLASYLYINVFRDLPNPTRLKEDIPALSTKILDRHGVLLYQIFKDENRSLVNLSEIPATVINATLAAEDKNFYHHHGIDVSGIIRALYKNLVTCRLSTANCTLEGGSTITQQLIKNTLLTSEKTFTRKLKELILALRTETLYSKDEILEMYFNQVPYGGTAYGIEEASKQYLGKSIRDVNLAEAAFLSGLPVSPTTLSPYGTNPYLAKIRQESILASMVALGMIDENTKLQAVASPVLLKPQGTSIQAPHFVMYIRDLLVKEFGETAVSRGGLTVLTTLDLAAQNILQKEISAELTRLNNLNVTNGAGLVIDPPTGEILAMVGSRDFFDTAHDGQVNITLQPRQPGSAIKPLTYALAFMRGLSPSSTIEDSPVCFRSVGSPDYCPKNYDGKFHGTITLKTALASSYNIPAIKLLNSLGVKNLIELSRELGITTWNDPSRFGLALTLGGGEVTMIDLAQVYSVFATGGTKIPLKGLLQVSDATGQLLPLTPSPQPKQILPESIAFQISSTLSDNSARSAAFGANSVLNIKNHVVAVKTGTTNNLRDNWTIGYTPNLLVATWVGNNDNSPMSRVVSGITGASPIWNRTISTLLKDTPATPFRPPNTLVRAKVSCSSNAYDYFIRGTEPKLNCDAPETGQVL